MTERYLLSSVHLEYINQTSQITLRHIGFLGEDDCVFELRVSLQTMNGPPIPLLK